MIKTHARELAVATTIALLAAVLATTTQGYFSHENLTDLFLANVPVIVIALGMTLIILTGEIDISVGSSFAVCSILMGVCARAGIPDLASGLIAILAGALCGALNGALVAYLRIPSIVVTLATMVALRDGLRWLTQGSWIGGLPAGFQYFGMGQIGYTAITATIVVVLIAAVATSLRWLRAGRAIFATGSNKAAARIVGINTERVVFSVFTLTGALTGLAAMLNAVRFNQIPSNSGLGLEMKVIAAVAVGGAAITGGSGTISGTVLGVALLGMIGPALTFSGVSAYWEKAIQGGIILAAVTANVLGRMRRRNAALAG
ncbi:MAG TPA: ABC transporter permease [Granulicella sp.]